MKKQLLLFAMILLPLVVSAHDIKVQNADGKTIYYNYINDGTELEVTYQGSTSYDYSNEYQGNVAIPEEVTYMNRTRKVTSIGDRAFCECSSLTSITIPNSVTSIGDYAFTLCKGLTSITIPNSVTSIGERAFCDCKGLTSITIGNSVTSIGSYAFYECSGLKKVIVKDIAAWCGIKFDGSYSNPLTYAKHLYSDEDTEITNLIIPNSVTSIGRAAFEYCSGLTSVTIPNSVTSIGDCAFLYCSRLTSVTIPNSVTSIGVSAFCDCKGLTSITIGSGVTSIGEWAFSECSRLTSVTIPNSVTSIGERAFTLCSSLTSITIPNSVTSIGDYAFTLCKGLTSITIPNSVTSIGSYAFSGCSGLTSISVESGNEKYDSRNNCNAIIETASNTLITGCKNTVIPNSVTSIGGGAFSGCSGLTSITIPNSVTSIGQSAFSGCSGLTSVTIPNSVTSIGQSAFSGCSGLTSVTIPNSVTSIGDRAFDGVDFPTVVSLIENPFKITGKTSSTRTFTQNTFNNATLYVPKGTIDKYKATDGWKDFFFIEEGVGPGGDTPQPPTPEPQKCEKPTISYENGKLTFSSATDGAVCQYSITDTDIKAGSGNEVQLGVTYNISVYATKSGFDNSETATATLCWIDAAPKTEGIANGIANIPANAVLIQSEGGSIKVQGVDDGMQVNVYGINGTQAGSAISQSGAATINTNLQPGSIAIVKIGQKSVKVAIK